MKLVCAAHPTLDAVARCVTCGRHLCATCRKKVGIRNYCRGCQGRGAPARERPPARRAGAAAAAMEGGAVALCSSPGKPARRVANRSPRSLSRGTRSPALAAMLSLVPGLGQFYAASFLRGIAFFGAAVVAQEAGAPPVLAAFLYVFNLWDAYRCAQARNRRVSGLEQDPKELRRDRVDETAFSLTGLATLAYTFVEQGGMEAQPIDTLIPLAAIAACLVLAQETRA